MDEQTQKVAEMEDGGVDSQKTFFLFPSLANDETQYTEIQCRRL